MPRCDPAAHVRQVFTRPASSGGHILAETQRRLMAQSPLVTTFFTAFFTSQARCALGTMPKRAVSARATRNSARTTSTAR